ncbi:MAG: ABC transporter permease subunit [Candidatus Roizmanbacteria bacterium]|nr:ABC transporter permease subunit [Candidatus Roizmanbacteria bacterium]
MKALYKKELMQILNSPVGYSVPVAFALFLGYLFIKDVFVVGSASLKPFFSVAPWLLFILIPALSMRSISEEKRANTIEVLMTLPLSEDTIVFSKLLSLLTIISITLGLTLSIPIVLGLISTLYIPEIIVGYIGLLLLSTLYLSFSLYISSRFSNQIASFSISALILFLVTTLSSDFLANLLPKTVQDVLLFGSPILHLDNFIKGIVDLRSLSYFIMLIVLFFKLTVIELKKRS